MEPVGDNDVDDNPLAVTAAGEGGDRIVVGSSSSSQQPQQLSTAACVTPINAAEAFLSPLPKKKGAKPTIPPDSCLQHERQTRSKNKAKHTPRNKDM